VEYTTFPSEKAQAVIARLIVGRTKAMALGRPVG